MWPGFIVGNNAQLTTTQANDPAETVPMFHGGSRCLGS